MAYQGQRAAPKTSSRRSRDESPDDERDGCLCGSADDRPDLEHDDGNQVHELHGEQAAQLSESRLECHERQEIGAAIPPDEVQVLEIGRESGDGGCCQAQLVCCRCR